jgi:hypothetical protein
MRGFAVRATMMPKFLYTWRRAFNGSFLRDYELGERGEDKLDCEAQLYVRFSERLEHSGIRTSWDKLMKPIRTPKLKDVTTTVFIVAHKEDTSDLETAMVSEGFTCHVIRGPYSAKERTYPAAVRCLINHSNAWRKIVKLDDYAIVVEADFVPVKGIASLPLPFDPSSNKKSMAWLYSVGPVIYHVDPLTQAMYGHNAGTVAYILDKAVANEWLSLFDDEMKASPNKYRLWDVNMPIRLRWERGVRCYIPYKMYGEHGGRANPEHKQNKNRSWHEADVLAGSLHFMPTYGKVSTMIYIMRRIRGRTRGIYRFLAGKNFDGWRAWWRSGGNRGLKLRLAFQRLL